VINISGITLKEALKLDVLKTSGIIAGQEGVGNVITKVNVMVDQEIVKWIGKGELILITANHLESMSSEEQISLIREMASKELAGIGIKVQPYMEQLPEPIIEVANELRLPIIDLDYKVSFTDLMEIIFKEIFNQQSKVIARVETVHKDIMNIILKGGGIEDIVKTLTTLINNPIIVKDFHFDEFIYFYDDEKQNEYINIENDLERILNRKKSISKARKTMKMQTILDGENIDILAVPVIAKNTVCGYIFMYGIHEEITNLEILQLESTAPLIALEFLKRISVQHVENKYKREFFDDLISKEPVRRNSALERMNFFKFHKEKFYSVLSIKLNRESISAEYEEEFIQKIDKGLHIIEMILKQEMKAHLVTSIKENITVLLMWDDIDGYKKNIKRLTDRFYQELAARITDIEFSIGIGRAYNGIENTFKSLEDSEKALEATGGYVEEKTVFFDDLGIYKIFCHEGLKDELISFFETTLKPLVIYDRKKDTELVKTLEAYFEVNGNLKKMSELLFTHYNTVLYRVGRIQEITKTNLDNERERFGLQTAIQIMKILNL